MPSISSCSSQGTSEQRGGATVYHPFDSVGCLGKAGSELFLCSILLSFTVKGLRPWEVGKKGLAVIVMDGDEK